jgi:hypothetical protein
MFEILHWRNCVSKIPILNDFVDEYSKDVGVNTSKNMLDLYVTYSKFWPVAGSVREGGGGMLTPHSYEWRVGTEPLARLSWKSSRPPILNDDYKTAELKCRVTKSSQEFKDITMRHFVESCRYELGFRRTYSTINCLMHRWLLILWSHGDMKNYRSSFS